MDKPQIIIHAQKSVNFTLHDCRWIPCTARFVVLGDHARGTGAFQIYEVSQGDVKLTHECEKSKSLKCGTFGASPLPQRLLAAGDFAGKLQIWDVASPDLPVYAVQAHKEIINCIDGVGGLGVGEGAPEIVTGSRDGMVKVWDPRQNNDAVATMKPADGEVSRDCWTVAFGHAFNVHDRCVAAGYDNGDVKLFDLRAMALRWETNVKNGVCSLEFDRKDIEMNKLVVAGLESKFHVFDMRTQHPKKGFACVDEKNHQATIWSCRHLPQNRDVFMTLGGNGSLNLWKYNYPSQRSVEDSDKLSVGVAGTVSLLQDVTFSTQPIAALDWNHDKLGLCVTTSFDQTIRVLIITKLKSV